MGYEFYGRVKRIEFNSKNKMGEFKAESSVKFNDKTYDIAFNTNLNNVNQSSVDSKGTKSRRTSSTKAVIIVPQQLILNRFFIFISTHSNSRFLIEFDNNTVTKVTLCNE